LQGRSGVLDDPELMHLDELVKKYEREMRENGFNS